MNDSRPYRQNAAVIITDGQGKVLLCERNDPAHPFIQTVQGGIDDGETPRQAAERELMEEVGLTTDQFRIVDELAEKSFYEFTEEANDHPNLGKYRGQEQTFFLAEVDPNIEFILDGDNEQEFARVSWGTPQEFVEKAWSLKRPGIEKALRGFGLLS